MSYPPRTSSFLPRKPYQGGNRYRPPPGQFNTAPRGEDTQPNESVYINRARVVPMVAEVTTPRAAVVPGRSFPVGGSAVPPFQTFRPGSRPLPRNRPQTWIAPSSGRPAPPKPKALDAEEKKMSTEAERQADLDRQEEEAVQNSLMMMDDEEELINSTPVKPTNGGGWNEVDRWRDGLQTTKDTFHSAKSSSSSTPDLGPQGSSSANASAAGSSALPASKRDKTYFKPNTDYRQKPVVADYRGFDPLAEQRPIRSGPNPPSVVRSKVQWQQPPRSSADHPLKKTVSSVLAKKARARAIAGPDPVYKPKKKKKRSGRRSPTPSSEDEGYTDGMIPMDWIKEDPQGSVPIPVLEDRPLPDWYTAQAHFTYEEYSAQPWDVPPNRPVTHGERTRFDPPSAHSLAVSSATSSAPVVKPRDPRLDRIPAASLAGPSSTWSPPPTHPVPPRAGSLSAAGSSSAHPPALPPHCQPPPPPPTLNRNPVAQPAQNAFLSRAGIHPPQPPSGTPLPFSAWSQQPTHPVSAAPQSTYVAPNSFTAPPTVSPSSMQSNISATSSLPAVRPIPSQPSVQTQDTLLGQVSEDVKPDLSLLRLPNATQGSTKATPSISSVARSIPSQSSVQPISSQPRVQPKDTLLGQVAEDVKPDILLLRLQNETPANAPPSISPAARSVSSLSSVHPEDTLQAQIPVDVKPDKASLVVRLASPPPPPPPATQPTSGSQAYLRSAISPEQVRELWSSDTNKTDEKLKRKKFTDLKRIELANMDRIIKRISWRDDGVAYDWELKTNEGQYTVLGRPFSNSEEQDAVENEQKRLLTNKGKVVKVVSRWKDRVVYLWWGEESEAVKKQTKRTKDTSSVVNETPSTGSRPPSESAPAPSATPSEEPRASTSSTSGPVSKKTSRKGRSSIKEKLGQNPTLAVAIARKAPLRNASRHTLPVSSPPPLSNVTSDALASSSVQTERVDDRGSSLMEVDGDEILNADMEELEELREAQAQVAEKIVACHERIRQRTRSASRTNSPAGSGTASPVHRIQFDLPKPDVLPRQIIACGLPGNSERDVRSYFSGAELPVLDYEGIGDVALITFAKQTVADRAVLKSYKTGVTFVPAQLVLQYFRGSRAASQPVLKKPKVEKDQEEIDELDDSPASSRAGDQQAVVLRHPLLSEPHDFGVQKKHKSDSPLWVVAKGEHIAYASYKGTVGLFSTTTKSSVDEAEMVDLRPDESVSDLVFAGDRLILSRNYYKALQPAANSPQISSIDFKSDITPRVQSCPVAPHNVRGVTCLAALPSRQPGQSLFVSGGYDGVVQRWSMSPEGVATTVQIAADHHDMAISSLAFSHLHLTLFSTSMAGTVSSFDFTENRIGHFGIPKASGGASISQIYLNNDPNLILIEYNNADPFQLYDYRRHKSSVISLKEPAEPNCFFGMSRGQFSGNLFLKGTKNGQLKVWDVRRPDEPISVLLHPQKTQNIPIRQVLETENNQLVYIAGPKLYVRGINWH